MLNPRNLSPPAEWDRVRRQAYRKYAKRCWACGEQKPLDAHEVFEFDYTKLEATFQGVIAACQPCHRFIHIGRFLRTYDAGDFEWSYVQRVIQKRVKLLKSVGARPHWTQHYILLRVLPNNPWPGRTLPDPRLMQAYGWTVKIGDKTYTPDARKLEVALEWDDLV